MNLSGSQKKQLQEALLSAFPSEADLQQMVLFELDQNLAAIASGQKLKDIVFELIIWSESNGLMLELLEGSYKANPSNSKLASFVAPFSIGGNTVPNVRNPKNDSRRKDHSLLPWLVNRREQDLRLSEAIRRLDQTTSRPVVGLVCGYDVECHDKFVERLEKYSLHRMLREDPYAMSIRRICLEWPPRFENKNELLKRLRYNMAIKVLNDDYATPKEINDYLADADQPVLIETYLPIERIDEDSVQHNILGYLEFWQQWPMLAPGQRIIVCLCISCNRPATQRWQFWSKARREHLDEQTEKFLHKNVSESRFDKLVCTILPRLQAITLVEAYNWASDDDVIRYSAGKDIAGGIADIFANWESEHSAKEIPIRYIVPELARILGSQNHMEEQFA